MPEALLEYHSNLRESMICGPHRQHVILVFKVIHVILLSLEVQVARRVLLGDFRAPFHSRSVKFNLKTGGKRRRIP
jgi:hypothetical protein